MTHVGSKRSHADAESDEDSDESSSLSDGGMTPPAKAPKKRTAKKQKKSPPQGGGSGQKGKGGKRTCYDWAENYFKVKGAKKCDPKKCTYAHYFTSEKVKKHLKAKYT